jgi:hypothetical protein
MNIVLNDPDDTGKLRILHITEAVATNGKELHRVAEASAAASEILFR